MYFYVAVRTMTSTKNVQRSNIIIASNYRACGDFPTGVELADDTTALLIY